MSLVDAKKTAEHITSWMKQYSTDHGIKCGVLGLSGGVDSALVALLWKRTGLPLICVNLPCHSSDVAWNRAKAFADEYQLNLRKVDLSIAHNVLLGQSKDAFITLEGSSLQLNGTSNPIAIGGMRSCLRPVVLNFLTNSYRGLILGTGNRSEDHITRYFQKFGDGCVDISPISDLFKSEVYELFCYLSGEMNPRHEENKSLEPVMIRSLDCSRVGLSARAIIQTAPTADLWGPDAGQEDEKELGISYDEIEWADRLDVSTSQANRKNGNGQGIIFSDSDPAKTEDFYRYTSRQQAVISKLWSMEKQSRHKMNPNLPVCLVRSEDGLVR